MCSSVVRGEDSGGARGKQTQALDPGKECLTVRRLVLAKSETFIFDIMRLH